jgi:hypothetical protein
VLVQRVIDTGLVSTERPAALEYQDDAQTGGIEFCHDSHAHTSLGMTRRKHGSSMRIKRYFLLQATLQVAALCIPGLNAEAFCAQAG